MSSRRSLQTILFTDIVASTDRATELGDRGWSELLQEHNTRARREIRRFGGREIKALGDGFLVAFPRPSQAVRCAWAIRESTRELGLQVRGGIHTGEVEHRGTDLSGIAVHICSRIAARAGPGEILVSNALREMETGSGFRFQDRGKHELKGVSGEWRLFALESLPAGTALRTSRWIPELTTRQTRIAVASVLGVLLVTMILWAVRNHTQFDGDSESPTIAAAAPGIAVVPFRVTDPSLELWREGMVDLLSTNLDGVASLRAISSRTVMARWREATSESEALDLERTLEVVRKAGARYAILGSVHEIRGEMRLAAATYDLESGTSIGTAEAGGPPDSVFVLVDRLSTDILRAILQGKTDVLPPAPRLASVTTTSLTALKAYLEGEALYRRADFREAIAAYERAVESDSLFALAYYRLAHAWGWVSGWQSMNESIDRALKYGARLPSREARLLRAYYAFSTRSPYSALDLLREAVRRHPDDPEAWYLLGDVYLHAGPQILAEEHAKRAFTRAVELDPEFAPFQIHLLQMAFEIEDSAAIGERLQTYSRTVEVDDYERAAWLALAFVFGDSVGRSRARAAMDTISTEVLSEAVIMSSTRPPFSQTEEVIRSARKRIDATALEATFLFWLLRREGKLEAAFQQLEDPLVPDSERAAGLYHLTMDGLKIPAERVQLATVLQPADTASWFYAGAYAAEQGLWIQHAAAVRALREAAGERGSAGDSVRARIFGGAADALDGYARWRRGDARDALSVLEPARQAVVGLLVDDPQGAWNRTIRRWLGLLNLELGQRDQAIRYLESLLNDGFRDTFAAYRLGSLYEEQGEVEKAIDAYDYVVSAWQGADPELQPRVETARVALARLLGTHD